MSHKKKNKSPKKGMNKTFASRRTLNPTAGHEGPQNLKAPSSFQAHDALNRMGSFETRGEHARTGNRGHQ
jgi:hypothetical protein